MKEMTAALKGAGFVVVTKENLRSPRHFLEALDETLKKEAATPEDVLLVYYSGHGLQLDGKSHLLSTGVSATARVAEDLRDNAQSTEDLLAEMERAIPGTRILIVEACRDNVLGGGQGAAQVNRGGFAFQQDDVPNTFVMFANKPGATTPARADYGLMGPFTDSFVLALQTSGGDLLDVFSTAKQKTEEISPGQEPVLYHSKTFTSVVLRPQTGEMQDKRARELLNSAEPLYRARAWDQFTAAVTRGKALAAGEALRRRLEQESEFARHVVEAERAEETQAWAEAAERWRKAADIFAAREWVVMKAAVASLLADDLTRGVQSLAVIGARPSSPLAAQAKQMLADLTREFPALEAVASKAASEAPPIGAAAEFETLQDKER
jgi:hypothetical protein